MTSTNWWGPVVAEGYGSLVGEGWDRLAPAPIHGTLAELGSWAASAIEGGRFFAVDSGVEFVLVNGSPVLMGSRERLRTLASASGSVTVDLADGTSHALTLTGNVTLTLAGALGGADCSVTLRLTQDGTGSRTVTWPSSVKWAGGTPPTLSTAAGARDVVTLTTINGGTTWDAFLAGKGMA